MTKREKEIIEILRKNPMISQNDLASKLGISRSSAAVHITNLMKKGVILGKGYVINEENFVAVMGGANIDILGFPYKEFIEKDSNPGYVVQSVGGVGRNISENLARLGVPVRFFSTVGDDLNGQIILDRTEDAGVDISGVIKVKSNPTGVYLSMQDKHGEMINAISQMEIYDSMDETYPESVAKILESASKIVLDTNLSQKALNYLVYRLQGKEIYVDTVSVNKAGKLKNILPSIDTIKPNRLESESLSGIKITDTDSLRDTGVWFMEHGVRNLYLSLGREGIYVKNRNVEGRVVSDPVEPVNTNGSGDALMAGIIMTSFDTDDVREQCIAGMAASIIALRSEETINRNLNPDIIKDVIEECNIRWKDI